jgi:threonine/homoserine efflux transporter RhtA
MNIGILYSLLYVFSLVISTLWLQSLGKHYAVYLLLTSSSLLAILTFNGINIKSIIKTHAVAIKDYKSWFLMSFYLMLAWVFTYLSATINSLIFLAVVFLANALFASIHSKQWVKLVINVVIIIMIYWANMKNGVTLAELYAVGAGLASFLYFSKSADFAKKHDLTPVQVLSIRFYLLFIFSICMLAFYSHPVAISFSWTDILILVCLAVFNQILPNFFSQSGLQHLGKTEFSFFVTLTPFLAFLMYEIVYQQWSYYMCILTFFGTVALNYDWLANKYKNRENRKSLIK